MSRKENRRRAAVQAAVVTENTRSMQQAVAQATSVYESRADAMINMITGLGTGMDKRLSTEWKASRPIDVNQLDTMIVDDDMIHNIVFLPAEEMTRAWVDLQGDRGSDVEKELNRIGARRAFTTATAWERAYGGALILIGMSDQPMLIDMSTGAATNDVDYSKPLVPGGTIEWLMVFDRYEIGQVVLDQFGAPEFYDLMVKRNGMARRVHHSRVIRFDGEEMPRRRRELAGWGQSTIQRIRDRVRDLNVGTEGVAAGLTDFDVSVVKLDKLTEVLAADKGGVNRRRLAEMGIAKSMFRMLLLDKDDDFSNVSRNFGSVPELVDRLVERVASAARMPVSLLMGRSPAGLNATGDSDMRWWFAHIEAQQEQKLRTPLERLIYLISLSMKLPDDDVPTLTFRPLWTPTEGEQATIHLTQAQADQIYFGMGFLDAEQIARSRFSNTGYSVDTFVDWDEIDSKDKDEDSKDPAKALSADDSDVDDDGNPIAPVAGGGGTDVQKTALNGAQVAAAQSIVADVASKKLPRDSGVALLEMAFQLSTADAERIMGSAGRDFVPAGEGGTSSGAGSSAPSASSLPVPPKGVTPPALKATQIPAVDDET